MGRYCSTPRPCGSKGMRDGNAEAGHGPTNRPAHYITATRGRQVDCLLRHEVARLIVWHTGVTRPAVPSAVSYADVREGNDPYRACEHGTHSHPTGTRTVRGRCICQHQAEMGLDGWYGEQM